jgi:hypothetical protein
MNTIRAFPTCKPSWPRSDSTGSRSHAANLRAIASLLAAAGLSLCTQSALAIEVYSCEDLPTDVFLDGQDGWRVEPGAGQAVVLLDVSGNGTKVLCHHKTVVFDRPAFATRANHAGFDFVGFSGTETNAIMQFEATGEYVAMFALGCDRDGDGLLTSVAGEIGPAFGAFDRKFRSQEANLGTAYENGFNEGDGDGNSGNDWYRIQLRMGFTANGGEGTASLYFTNLTDGDSGFHTVSGLRNRPLGLSGLHADVRPSSSKPPDSNTTRPAGSLTRTCNQARRYG